MNNRIKNKISLAGDLGSGKSTIGKILEREEGFTYYSTGTIQRNIATARGMTTYELNKYMETHPEIDDEIDNGLRALENSDLKLIIDSRMAWHFVPASFAVYLAADPAVAARRIMNAKRDSEPFSSIEEAIESLRLRRESEKKRYFDLYGVDITDMNNYDAVVDTSSLSPEQAAHTVLDCFKRWQRGERFAERIK